MAFNSKLNLAEIQKAQQQLNGKFTRASKAIMDLGLGKETTEQVISILDQAYKNQLGLIVPSLAKVEEKAVVAPKEVPTSTGAAAEENIDQSKPAVQEFV